MIVSVCGDAAGVTSLALALGAMWPLERVVLEADPSGGDAVFWLHHADGQRLRPEPTVLTLAADARGELSSDSLPGYAQPTALGVPVVHGAPSVTGFAPAERLWPRIAALAAGWSGTAITDLGRLIARHPGLALLRASTVVVLQARADVAGLHRLRERVTELPALLTDQPAETPPLAVVVRGAARERHAALGHVHGLLDAVGSPVPVVGFVPDDPRAVAALRAGGYADRVRRTRLARAAGQVAESLLAGWPALAAAPPNTWIPDSGPGVHAPQTGGRTGWVPQWGSR